MPVVFQGRGNRAADVPGATGDENFHKVTPEDFERDLVPAWVEKAAVIKNVVAILDVEHQCA
jgi:hypothetical protein